MLRTNRIVAWVTLSVGAGTGLLLGTWSFAGPMPVPEVLGDYVDVSRRLARLGHIALFGLGILNLLLVREFPRLVLSDRLRRLACRAMNFGNIFLPLTLFAAALWHPLKYTMPLPACAVFIALSICAYGALQTAHDDAASDS